LNGLDAKECRPGVMIATTQIPREYGKSAFYTVMMEMGGCGGEVELV
jgi:hypothetical protein